MRKYLIFFIIILWIFLPISTSLASSQNSLAPRINARHAVILDRNSQTILYGKKEKQECKMASTTKIMTAIVVIETTNLNDIVTVSSKAARTGGSKVGLSANCKISVEDLLYGLMLKSGNDAAVALAKYVGNDLEGFASLMNKKAQDLNLSSTHFVTPHGLDSNDHYTTAFDLAILSNYALHNKIFSKIVKTKNYTITLNGKPKIISNSNELLGNLDGVYGVKTGFTNGANRCLVTSCKRGNLDIICVVLGCDTKNDRTKDSINLINYTFNNFSVVNIENIIKEDFEKWYNEHNKSFTINKGISNSLELELNNDNLEYTKLAVNNNNIDNINTSIAFNSYYEAPLIPNTKVGTIALEVGDITYLEIDILNKNEIKKKHVFHYFIDMILGYSNYFNSNLIYK